jgi:hypothetical protein
MRGKVALVREQGQSFAVLLVKSSVLSSKNRCEEIVAFGEQEFGVRTALIGEDGRTWGSPDIVRWLKGVLIEQLPWRDFSTS